MDRNTGRFRLSDLNISPEWIKDRARHWHKQQVAWRRHLHQHPEISNEEVETTAYLKERLAELDISILPLDMATGVLAEVSGKRSGSRVAIRSDIDALPVRERNDIPFKSTIDGKMHACGHDVHMATVLGAAAVLGEIRDQLPGNVRLLFQPAEEMPPGGAKPMIERGALDGVDTVFGLHVEPMIPVGKIGLRDGAMMASVYEFDLVVEGRGGHAAQPHLAVDAIVTAAEVINGLQTVVARETGPMSPLVISIGRIEGGGARNVVADRVTLNGTARTLSPDMRKTVPKLIRRTVAGICKARGAKFEITELASYPVLVNDAATNALYESEYTRLFGRNKSQRIDAVLGGEDFAYYVDKVPGAMFRLGIRNPKIKANQPWHSPHFMVDEEAIYHGTALL
ncbi:amidohydrolase, partial [candidate division GN15 bacterium]|nr:amidohydrolase [candidate division GN15 bacterium]